MKGRKKTYKNKSKTINKMAIRTYISITTLNKSELNSSTKRHRLVEWIRKQDLYTYCLQETHFRSRDTYRLKVRGWKKVFHAKGYQKKAGVSIVISDEIDFKIKTVTRDKVGHYIMIKGSIQKEDITIANIYAPSIRAPQYIRQILTAIKGEINSNTIIVGDFNIPLSSKDRSSRQMINKETQALNDILDQKDLIDLYRALHPIAAECRLFSSAHETFSRFDHVLGHKVSLGKLKKIEIISDTFSYHNTMRLEIDYKEKKRRKHKDMDDKQYATKQPMDH